MAKTVGWDAFFMTLSDKFWNELDDDSRKNLEGEPLPEDVRRAACMIHPHPVGWFDNPIPNEELRTPRQLLERKGGADKLRLILMEIAPAFLPDSGIFTKSA